MDVCADHGLWLDAGELVPILHFVKTRAELGAVPLTEAEKEEEARLAKERELSIARQRQIDASAEQIDYDLRFLESSETAWDRRWKDRSYWHWCLHTLVDPLGSFDDPADPRKRRR